MNRYTYVANNPLNLTDPVGLDLYLRCTGESDTCHEGKAGEWEVDEDGNRTTFKTKLLQTDAEGNAEGYKVSFDADGIHVVDANGNRFRAGFEAGTDPTVVRGEGDFKGATAKFTDDCLGTCIAAGTLSGMNLATLKAADSVHPFVLDKLNPFHRGTVQFRGENGEPMHITVPKKAGETEIHYDKVNPFRDVASFFKHQKDVREYKRKMKELKDHPPEHVPK